MSSKKDTFGRTIAVAVGVCLVASVVVSTAAVKLKPIQQTNKLIDKQSNILAVAGFDTNGVKGNDIAALFDKNIETRVLDLSNGQFTTAVDPKTYDQRAASKNPSINKVLSGEEDIASIKTRAPYASVYLVKNNDGSIKRYILPVHGYGLWSTLYGFVAVEADAQTIYGLSFYSHAETPGLGGEVDNSKWKAQWRGKVLYDNDGSPKIQVVKFGGLNAENKAYSVDGLAGASLTTQGVNNLIKFWFGDLGYAPFLTRLNNLKG